ncbi:hypothetical protein ACM43_12200 [Bradyrhizobium sp. CCBAU 45321]|uniref:hypothetical protein n=1 Tax=Bradyrhizobium sp. CCBAU 45321 TaxID=1641878 RepID=UPI0023041B22|nr:hypothetical protein [Bradyrhizobium sp. CCBAU 45321]MDA9545190.1 hypothetical protein [Bradyrhizobium sp. CCBAU 45321]
MFEKVEKKEKLPRKSVSSRGTMTNDDWPIGLLPDGRLNVVNPRAIEDTHNERIQVERLRSGKRWAQNGP